MLLGLLIGVAGLMATACFGLSVLLISTVGWLWPTKSVESGSVSAQGKTVPLIVPGYSLRRDAVAEALGADSRLGLFVFLGVARHA